MTAWLTPVKSVTLRSRGEAFSRTLLTNILHYLTEGDWDLISVPNCPATKLISVLATRLSKLQMDSLDEQAKREAIKVVLHLRKVSTGAMPKYKVIHGWVLDLKKEHESMRVPRTCTIVTKYPPLPAQLPRDVYAACYDESDPQVAKEIENFSSYGAHIPLRGNSALLKREAASEIQNQPVSWAQLAALQQGQLQLDGGLPGFRLLPPRQRNSLTDTAYHHGLLEGAEADRHLALGDMPRDGSQSSLGDGSAKHSPAPRSEAPTPQSQRVPTAGLAFKPAGPRMALGDLEAGGEAGPRMALGE